MIRMHACIGTWLGRYTDCGCDGAFDGEVQTDADSNSGERDERALRRDEPSEPVASICPDSFEGSYISLASHSDRETTNNLQCRKFPSMLLSGGIRVPLWHSPHVRWAPTHVTTSR